MDRNNRARAVRSREASTLEVARYFRNIQVAGVGIDINERGPRADLHDCLRSRDERHWSSDDFVAGSDSGRQQSEPERVGSASHADDMTRAEERGEFVFECGDLRATNVRSLFVDFREAALDLRHDFTVLCREVQKFYWHLVRLPGVMQTGGGRNIAGPVFPRRWLERERHWSPTRRRQPSRPHRSRPRT